MAKSNIEWTDYTINPVTGCTKISDGCKNCYAEKMHKRLQKMGHKKYEFDFSDVVIYREELNKIAKIKKPSKIFIGSMADVFHEKVDDFDLEMMMLDIEKYPQHIFQFLTKRPERMLNFFNDYYDEYLCPLLHHPNIWLGVSVCNKSELLKIDILKSIEHVPVKFISFEPLLEDVGELDLTGIDWVIVGGETGAGAREMKPKWVLNILEQCVFKKISFFFKQWGSFTMKNGGEKIHSIKPYYGYGLNLEDIKQIPITIPKNKGELKNER